ncbi:MAG: cyanophycinase [Bacillota bacterium]
MGDTTGKLVIIGGAEDKDHDCTILKKVVDLAGGRSARLLVLTAATQEPGQVGSEYRQIFQKLGAAEVGVLDVATRLQAEDSMLARLVADATGVFFTGGDQLRITSVIGGTHLYHQLHRAYQQGAVIAGTSAGASVMSSTMIVQGPGEEQPRPLSARLAPGLGLVPDVVIDQHFAQRGRLGRLLAAVAQNPYVLGIGIDENTAMSVDNDRFTVLGTGTVTVLDGRDITFSNTSEASPADALALTDVRLHVLPAGHGFNLRSRRPIIWERSTDN